MQLIVNVIEPDHGNVFDPACGSGGMFVQTSHFIEHTGGDTTKKVVFYGQEKNRDTIRIAKMKKLKYVRFSRKTPLVTLTHELLVVTRCRLFINQLSAQSNTNEKANAPL